MTRTAAIPPSSAMQSDHPDPQNTHTQKADCQAAIARNQILHATRYHGRAFWKRWTGYHARSRIAAKMRGFKAFGERIAARHYDSQTEEIQIRVALINRFNPLSAAEILSVPLRQRGKGLSCARCDLRNNAPELSSPGFDDQFVCITSNQSIFGGQLTDLIKSCA